MYFLVDDEVISYLAKNKLMGDSNAIREYQMGQPLLYAVTTKKKIAKKFEESRNPKVFYKEVLDVEDGSEYYADNDAIINMSELYIGGKQTITLPLTENETWILESASENMLEVMKSANLPSFKIFTNEIQSILANISYTYCTAKPDDYMDDGDYMLDGMKEFRNEFGAFMLLFSKLINHEGLLKVGEINKNEG
jgi:hypothetical protein